MNAQESRDIPDQIQREVRQRCGFGCVVCGFPLYDYEHMLGWSNIHRHVASEITLLCDQHHREKESGLLPVEAVREANENPYNQREGISKPYDLHYSGSECEVIIGSNRFMSKDQGYGTTMTAISVDGLPLLGFTLSEGHLLLNLNVFDEYNKYALRIINNRLLYSTSPWDIQLVGSKLTIREAPRKILVDILFQAPNRVIVNRGRFLYNGVEILIYPNCILLVNNGALLLDGFLKANNGTGMVIQSKDLPPSYTASDVPHYNDHKSAVMKQARKRRQTLRKLKSFYEEARAEASVQNAEDILDFSRLSTSELKQTTLEFVASIRTLIERDNNVSRILTILEEQIFQSAGSDEERKEIWQSWKEVRSKLYIQTKVQYEVHFKDRAILLRDELLSRSPGYKEDKPIDAKYENAIIPQIMEHIADDLEELALRLEQ